jgi:hypothetical protein
LKPVTIAPDRTISHKFIIIKINGINEEKEKITDDKQGKRDKQKGVFYLFDRNISAVEK